MESNDSSGRGHASGKQRQFRAWTCQRKAKAAGAAATEIPVPTASPPAPLSFPAPAGETPAGSSGRTRQARLDPIGALETLLDPPAEDVPPPVAAPDNSAGSRVLQAARLPFALPSARGACRDGPVTMLLGALLYWRAHALVRRRRARRAG